MKITIIGGGPAGLYFACMIKQQIEDSDITVIEKKLPTEEYLGLGYTLQMRTKESLIALDRNYFRHLFPEQHPPTLEQAVVQVGNTTRAIDFYQGHGMRRVALLNYLRTKAQNMGIQIVYSEVGENDIERYQQQSQLLVGADGLHSVVRRKYANNFGVQQLQGNTVYLWLANTSPRQHSEVRFLINHYQDAVLMFTSYPLSAKKQAVIIETSNQSFKKTGLDKMVEDGRISKQGIEFIQQIFDFPQHPLALESSGMSWMPYKVNYCHQLYNDNVILLGDAAISFHYSLGAGLSSAFGMATIFTKHFASTGSIAEAARRFSLHVKNWLHEPYRISIADLRWLGEIDSIYFSMPSERFIDAFLEKSNFK